MHLNGTCLAGHEELRELRCLAVFLWTGTEKHGLSSTDLSVSDKSITYLRKIIWYTIMYSR